MKRARRVGAVTLAAVCAVAAPAASAGSVGRVAGADPPLCRSVGRGEMHVAATVGLRVFTFVDRSRVARFHGGRVGPRVLVTQIRYPAQGSARWNDVPDAAPLRSGTAYPLIVFGPGFAETGTVYARLLDAWARAGFIVAAPAFPLTQRDVPGGRRRSDLINQPGDMSFVITQMIDASADSGSFLYRLVAGRRVAVAGQSDGAATALAAAYDPRFADPRVGAAVILSGAEVSPIDDNIPFPDRGPPLLAAQGTRDPINEPSATYQYFALAPRPKFLLALLGAAHLPPYTTQQPYLGVVARVTVAFLDHFLRHGHDSLVRMRDCGQVADVASLTLER